MATQFETFKQDDVINVKVRGSLDAQSAGGLREQLKNLAASSAGNRIVLDLSQVPFMDSTGLAGLISGLKAVRQHGGELVLAGVTPEVMRIFQITLLDRAFTFIL